MEAVYNSKKRNKCIDVLFLVVITVIYAFSNIRILSIGMQFLFVVAMGLKAIKHNKLRLTFHFMWMSIFIIFSLFVTLFAYDVSLSFDTIINLSLKLMFYTAVIMYIEDEEKFLWFLHTLIIAGLILILRLILATPSTAWGTERLGAALDLNPNTIGLVLSYASISAVYLIKELNKSKYCFAIIPFVTVALFTGSRKAFLIICGGIALLLLLYSNKKKEKVISIMVAFFIIYGLYMIVMNIPMLYEVIGKRLEGMNIIAGNMNASTRTRLFMIQEAWEFFKTRPFIGYGLENFSKLSVFGTYSHNNYMEVICSTGIIGFFIYYSLPVGILVLSFKKKKMEKRYIINVVFLTLILVMDIALVSYKQLITQTIIAGCTSYYLHLKTKH